MAQMEKANIDAAAEARKAEAAAVEEMRKKKEKLAARLPPPSPYPPQNAVFSLLVAFDDGLFKKLMEPTSNCSECELTVSQGNLFMRDLIRSQGKIPTYYNVLEAHMHTAVKIPREAPNDGNYACVSEKPKMLPAKTPFYYSYNAEGIENILEMRANTVTKVIVPLLFDAGEDLLEKRGYLIILVFSMQVFEGPPVLVYSVVDRFGFMTKEYRAAEEFPTRVGDARGFLEMETSIRERLFLFLASNIFYKKEAMPHLKDPNNAPNVEEAKKAVMGKRYVYDGTLATSSRRMTGLRAPPKGFSRDDSVLWEFTALALSAILDKQPGACMLSLENDVTRIGAPIENTLAAMSYHLYRKYHKITEETARAPCCVDKENGKLFYGSAGPGVDIPQPQDPYATTTQYKTHELLVENKTYT